MPGDWVFLVAFILLVVAIVTDIAVLRLQIKTFHSKSKLQPLKRLLLTCVGFLIIGALPLTIVYANILWFHINNFWVVYTAILVNAMAKVVAGVVLYLIYHFRE